MLVLTFAGTIPIPGAALGGICGGFYALHLLIGFCCNSYFSQFTNIQHGSQLENEYNKTRNLTGYFLFTAECFHYETRHHTRTVSDGRGGTRI
jgi:hypothetical protein